MRKRNGAPSLRTAPADSEQRANRHPLDRLFEPQSIVVVGGSERPGSVGEVLLRNLRSGGYAGELHVVNPRHAEVQGMASLPNVRELGRPVDLAVVAVPADAALQVIEDCGAVGIGAALVISAGFA
jgi:acetyltransferase